MVSDKQTDRAGACVVEVGPDSQRYSRQDVTSYVRDWIIEELRGEVVDSRVPADAVRWIVEQLAHERTVRDRQADRLAKMDRKAAKRKRKKAKRKANEALMSLYSCSRGCHVEFIPYTPEGTGRNP